MRTILILSLIILSGCESSDNDSHVHARDESPHYFKDSTRVDNSHVGPTTFRLENDETICYQSGAGNIWCHWKVEQPK
jgi:hypothetical protein